MGNLRRRNETNPRLHREDKEGGGMKTLCPTCGGKGTIDDPQAPNVLNYCGPNGERCPQVTCQTCDGSGWITWLNRDEVVT